MTMMMTVPGSPESCLLSPSASRSPNPKDAFRECGKGSRRWLWCQRARSRWAHPQARNGDNLARAATSGDDRAPSQPAGFAVTFDEWDASVSDRGCSGTHMEERV